MLYKVTALNFDRGIVLVVGMDGKQTYLIVPSFTPWPRIGETVEGREGYPNRMLRIVER